MGVASTAVAIALGLALPGPASAATFDVNTTSDANADSTCGGVPGDCSIRQAIEKAVDGDTINIPAGHYVLTLGQLDISEALHLQGAGARGTVIDGNHASQVIRLLTPDNVTNPAVTIADVGVTGGTATVGGGIQAGTDLTLTRSTVQGNSAEQGGGIGVSPPTEGGVDSNLRIVSSTVSGNTAELGGGIYNGRATLTVINSTITGNTATGNSGNQLTGAGGGIFSASFGGQHPTLLANTTVASNSATGAGSSGGNVYVAPSQGSSFRIALQLAQLPTFKLLDTVVAAGTAEANANCDGDAPVSQGHNLVSDGACGSNPALGDISGNPQLKALANNGGQTDTLALTDGSPAIEAGDPNGCKDDAGAAITADQRGVARPQGARCDIGAVESAPPTSTTGDASNVTGSGATIAGTAGNPDVLPGNAHFQFGTSTDYGQVTPGDGVPAGTAPARMVAAGAKVSASNPSQLSADLTGLAPSTTYHYRLVVSNPDATRVGADRTFTTGPANSIPPPRPEPGPAPKPHKPNVRASQFSGRCFRSAFVFRGRVHVASTTKLRKVRITLDGRTIHRTTKARFSVRVGAGQLGAGYHVLLVRAVDRAGNVTTARRAFMRCRPRPVPAFTG